MTSLDELFEEAMQRPEGAERDAFMEASCAGDEERLRDLRGLVAAHGRAASFMASPAVDEPVLDAPVPTLIGRFRIEREIGRGGQGAVYLAEDTDLRRPVALKLLSGLGLLAGDTLLRFRREAELASKLRHPGLCTVLDAGTIDGTPYIAMELVEGPTLAARIAESRGALPPEERAAGAAASARTPEGRAEASDVVTPSSWSATRKGIFEILELLEKVARALHAAHEAGVVHRDIKPGNIVVTASGDPVVVDFGLARRDGPDSDTLTRPGDLLGTPAYMSPEQLTRGDGSVDARTDVYSLGATLYECLTLQRPFRAPTREAVYQEILHEPVTDPRRFNPQIPAELAVVLETAMEKDLDRRYQSAEEFADELHRIRSFEPIQARPLGSWIRLRRWAQRHPAAATALAAAFVLLVGGLAMTSWFLQETRAALEREGRERTAAVRAQRETDLERASVFRLRASQDLEELRRVADEELWPLSPTTAVEVARAIEGCDLWLARAEDLARGLDEPDAATGALGHHAQLARIRGRALPYSDADRERDRRSHPRHDDLMASKGRLATETRAQEVREGRAAPEEVTHDESRLPTDANVLNAMAWPLVDPERHRFGREAEGLALARRARDLASGPARALCGDTLAWALFANGLDTEALAASRQAIQDATEKDRALFESYLEKLRRVMASYQGERGRDRVASLEGEVADLERAVAARRTWSFDSSDDRWWHAQLARLVDELEVFGGPAGRFRGTDPSFGWGVQRRRELLDALVRRTLEEPARAWAEVRARIAASPKYSGLRLVPQMGLVPLGPDPDSGLEEFCDIATGTLPGRDPATRRLRLEDASGVVFVLIPAGTFPMGAQKESPDLPNHDPSALPLEGPVYEVTLAPFLIAKHEMTQGQWIHLTGGNPSRFFYQPGYRDGAGEVLRHPVESVSYEDCTRALGRFGLVLPTEAQWEFACRAGRQTAWWTGPERETLEGAVNLADAAALREGASWPSLQEWPGALLDDGFAVHAPAGTYRANAFGLHDLAGNVAEWCQDWFVGYDVAPREGDGLRTATASRNRIYRGGSFLSPASVLRSACRTYITPGNVSPDRGLRCARPLRSGG